MDFEWLQPRPEFSAAGVGLALALLLYLVLLEPLLGVRSYAYLRRHRSARPDALLRIYVLTLAVEATWLLLILLILLVSPALEPSAVGLALPTGSLLPLAAGFTTAAAVAQIAAGIVIRRRATSIPVVGDFSYMLPVTPPERRLAGFVAVGAGISEELLVRGLLIAFGVGVVGLSPLVAAGVATVLFGLVHLYQGWVGVLGTTVLGAVFAGLYLATGSLLLPIALHIAVDVRGLLLSPPPDLTTSAQDLHARRHGRA